jgi:hypothetical protein
MKYLRLLLILSLLALAIGGGFAPWVYRPPVALQLTPPGLAEYVKFLREVRLGMLQLQRLHFLLPLAIAAISLPLVAVNKELGIHWSLNWLLRFSVVPLALSLLSPIWAPERLIAAEFRWQTIVAAGCLGLALFAFVFSKLSLKWLVSEVALASVVGVGLALRQFYLANAAIAATYAGPVRLGWGGWLTIAGAAGVVVSALWLWYVPGVQPDG